MVLAWSWLHPYQWSRALELHWSSVPIRKSPYKGHGCSITNFETVVQGHNRSHSVCKYNNSRTYSCDELKISWYEASSSFRGVRRKQKLDLINQNYRIGYFLSLIRMAWHSIELHPETTLIRQLYLRWSDKIFGDLPPGQVSERSDQSKAKNCLECGKWFSNEDNLHIHMILHSERFPYRCSESGCLWASQDYDDLSPTT